MMFSADLNPSHTHFNCFHHNSVNSQPISLILFFILKLLDMIIYFNSITGYKPVVTSPKIQKTTKDQPTSVQSGYGKIFLIMQLVVVAVLPNMCK